MKKEAGVTLLNILTALAITAVGLTLATPNIVQMVEKIRFETQADNFVMSLNLARSEAIKRGINVTMCPSTDGATCAAAGNWNRGWIIQDANGVLLQFYPKLAGSTSIVADVAADYGTAITYQPNGLTSKVGGGALVLCYKDSSNTLNLTSGRTISISPTGRPNLEKNADHVGTITTTFVGCL